MIPLLLIPGMMCDARLFGPQLARFSGERAVQVAPITGHDSVPALAADILAHAPPRFALAGLSMGGIVAMEMLRLAPERIDRLALMDTNAEAETDAIKTRRAPQIEKVRAGALRAVMRDEMKPNYLADGPTQGAILDLCMAMATDLGPDAFIRQSVALMDRPDQKATLRGAMIPTLILCGAEDRLCPLHRHTLMRDLVAGSELVVIEGAGHLPTLEQPDAVNERLETWLTT